MRPKEETRLVSVPVILLPLSYTSILHCLMCEMELGSLIISSLPYGTMPSFVSREFWGTVNGGRRGCLFLILVCSSL